ncbi:MAG: potassium-transporting ATPase subunit KdpA [Planctomycetota bacterium]
MGVEGWLQIWVYLVAVIGLAGPLGWYLARVLEGHPPAVARALQPIERGLYALCGIDPQARMDWKQYAFALLAFNLVGWVALFLLLKLQGVLPLNPQHLPGLKTDTAFNVACSFVSNTNWQNYGGETTMSYGSQMAGLTVQNFLSAATGIACLLALIRGLRRAETENLGNFWCDLTRSVLYVLLPLSGALALALMSQGVIQNLTPYREVPLLEPVHDSSAATGTRGAPELESKTATTQTLAMGPVASQEAIKQLGTNGGGYFNVNSAHPFENPTPLSNFLEMLAILLIPAALCCSFGHLVDDWRQGWALLAAMTILFLAFLVPCVLAEQAGNPSFAALGVNAAHHDGDPAPVATAQFKNVDLTRRAEPSRQAQSGGNMEGKEVRLGIVNSALWATATTATSNGSVNSMHDSFTPLGGLMPMLLMQLGEVVYGGVGSGLYGMLVFAVCAVFVAGLMVGRTPEYLGKKIETFEMKMAALVILIPPLLVLVGTAIGVAAPGAEASIGNPGAHGFSQVLYAYSSMGNNNGSAFAGFNGDTPLHNWLGGVVMLIARYGLIVPVLAMAGSLARKKTVPAGAGTLPTHTPLFVVLLIGVVLAVGALTFIPALALGPLAEYLKMAG